MLTYGIPPEFRGGVHMKPPYAIGSVPSLSGHAVAYRWRSLPRVRRHRASTPQGSSERVLPWQITMDQLIFASLSHTHYWYKVGMLKVPAVSIIDGDVILENCPTTTIPLRYILTCSDYGVCISLYILYITFVIAGGVGVYTSVVCVCVFLLNCT